MSKFGVPEKGIGIAIAPFLSAFLLAVFLSMTGLSYAQSPAKLIRVYAWSDLIDGRIFDAFTRETGIRVAVDVYDTSDTMETRLRAGASGYDLVVAEGSALARLVSAKSLAPLDRAALGVLASDGFSLLLPDIMKAARAADPSNLHAIPYLWGSVGFGVDAAKIRALIGDPRQIGWEWLAKPEMLKRISACGVDVLDSPADIAPSLLKIVGAAPDSRRIEDIRRALALITRSRVLIRSFQSGGTMPALASRQACIVAGLSGDVLRARQRLAASGQPAEIDFIAPKEGSALWFDVLAVPIGARQPELANTLIAYLLRPDVAARVTLNSRFATSVIAARALLDPATMNDPALYPDAAHMRRILPATGYDARLHPLIAQEWKRIKTGK